MEKLKVEDLYSLEQYHDTRKTFRSDVINHKKHRQVAVGPNATLYFEDRKTIQYQIQEILRIEKIYKREDIEEELSAYNPLIPDGANFKATFMLEFPEEGVRREMLSRLIGIEDQIYINVGDLKVPAIADEDLERTTEDKTSAVHFLRFELSEDLVEAIKSHKGFSFSIEHENYNHISDMDEKTIESLISDLD